MKKYSKFVFYFLAATVVFLAACTDDEDVVGGIMIEEGCVESLLVGETTTFVERILPNEVTNKEVTWKSSNADIATVANGVVTAVSPGKVTITVTTVNGKRSASCSFEVLPQPILVQSVVLDQETMELVITNSQALVHTVLPEDATIKDVTWTSSDEEVATVDEKGLVTAVKLGTATITVTTVEGEKTATCQVTVVEPPLAPAEEISLDRTYPVALVPGADFTFIHSVLPLGASEEVVWASTNPNVATVDENGVVTAKAMGSTTISATTKDGTNLTASCDVNVAYDAKTLGWEVLSNAQDAGGYRADGTTGMPADLFDWSSQSTFFNPSQPGQNSTPKVADDYVPGAGTDLTPNLTGFTVDMKGAKKVNHVFCAHRSDFTAPRTRLFAFNIFGSNDNQTFTKINGAGTENLVWVPMEGVHGTTGLKAGYTAARNADTPENGLIYKIEVPECEYRYIRIEYAVWSRVYNSHFTDYDQANADDVERFSGVGQAGGGNIQLAIFGMGYYE